MNTTNSNRSTLLFPYIARGYQTLYRKDKGGWGFTEVKADTINKKIYIESKGLFEIISRSNMAKGDKEWWARIKALFTVYLSFSPMSSAFLKKHLNKMDELPPELQEAVKTANKVNTTVVDHRVLPSSFDSPPPSSSRSSALKLAKPLELDVNKSEEALFGLYTDSLTSSPRDSLAGSSTGSLDSEDQIDAVLSTSTTQTAAAGQHEASLDYCLKRLTTLQEELKKNEKDILNAENFLFIESVPPANTEEVTHLATQLKHLEKKRCELEAEQKQLEAIISTTTAKPKSKLGGLTNVGNTCYLNSAVRIMEASGLPFPLPKDGDATSMRAYLNSRQSEGFATGLGEQDDPIELISHCMRFDEHTALPIARASFPTEKEIKKVRATYEALTNPSKIEPFLKSLISPFEKSNPQQRLAICGELNEFINGFLKCAPELDKTQKTSLEEAGTYLRKLEDYAVSKPPVLSKLKSIANSLKKSLVSPGKTLTFSSWMQACRVPTSIQDCCLRGISPEKPSAQNLVDWGIANLPSEQDLIRQGITRPPSEKPPNRDTKLFLQQINRAEASGPSLGAINNTPVTFTDEIVIDGKKFRAKAVTLKWGATYEGGHHTCLVREGSQWIHYDDETSTVVKDLKDLNGYTGNTNVILWERVDS